jgi:pyrroloquinoline-quinone synthase
MNADEFLSALSAEILAHPFLTGPLVTRISTPGGVSRAQARKFALLYYPHIFRTRLYQANALGISPDEDMQFCLADILWDEYGNGDKTKTHPGVYRRLLRALDVTEAEYVDAPIFPELAMYIDTMMRLTQSGDWLSAFAAVGVASEWPIPVFYEKILVGLRTVPGLREEDLELFSSHIGIDQRHSQMARDVLAPYAANAADQRRIRTGVRINLDARHVMMNGLFREVFASAL